ncbi:hypothetical protein AKJ13_29815 [Methylobacterium sp. ARG-1]|nr:hypothetical protein AKJ13_29815 [Methylobacterium sp. ARG-1]
MDENDPHWDADPLWYDRAEADTPPGRVVEGLAYLVLLVLAGVAWGARVYRLPDALWCRAMDRLRPSTPGPRRS